ncbi:hypothetical protein [Pseudomonas phage PaVOB]|nr:hypothetical protein [Pseudomonas phage PaVOB]
MVQPTGVEVLDGIEQSLCLVGSCPPVGKIECLTACFDFQDPLHEVHGVDVIYRLQEDSSTHRANLNELRLVHGFLELAQEEVLGALDALLLHVGFLGFGVDHRTEVAILLQEESRTELVQTTDTPTDVVVALGVQPHEESRVLHPSHVILSGHLQREDPSDMTGREHGITLLLWLGRSSDNTGRRELFPAQLLHFLGQVNDPPPGQSGQSFPGFCHLLLATRNHVSDQSVVSTVTAYPVIVILNSFMDITTAVSQYYAATEQRYVGHRMFRPVPIQGEPLVVVVSTYSVAVVQVTTSPIPDQTSRAQTLFGDQRKQLGNQVLLAPLTYFQGLPGVLRELEQVLEGTALVVGVTHRDSDLLDQPDERGVQGITLVPRLLADQRQLLQQGLEVLLLTPLVGIRQLAVAHILHGHHEAFTPPASVTTRGNQNVVYPYLDRYHHLTLGYLNQFVAGLEQEIFTLLFDGLRGAQELGEQFDQGLPGVLFHGQGFSGRRNRNRVRFRLEHQHVGVARKRVHELVHRVVHVSDELVPLYGIDDIPVAHTDDMSVGFQHLLGGDSPVLRGLGERQSLHLHAVEVGQHFSIGYDTTDQGCEATDVLAPDVDPHFEASLFSGDVRHHRSDRRPTTILHRCLLHPVDVGFPLVVNGDLEVVHVGERRLTAQTKAASLGAVVLLGGATVDTVDGANVFGADARTEVTDDELIIGEGDLDRYFLLDADHLVGIVGVAESFPDDSEDLVRVQGTRQNLEEGRVVTDAHGDGLFAANYNVSGVVFLMSYLHGLLLGLGAFSATFLVGEVSDHLQMSGVAAQPLSAEMVDLFLTRHIAEVVGEHDDVDGNCLAVQAHSPVTTAPARTRIRALPEVAGTWLTVEDEARVFDFAAGFDTFPDFFSASFEHGTTPLMCDMSFFFDIIRFSARKMSYSFSDTCSYPLGTGS